MESPYQRDLAYIHAMGFGGLARGAASEIARLLRSATIRIERVVDVGCGAGPLTKALVEEGFEVTGIDTSVELLEIAHTVSPTARFVNASIYETQIPACEAVVAIGEPLAYHDDPDADHLVGQFFRRGREVHKVRLFDTPAVCAELASCGFTTRTAGGLLGE